MINRHHAKIIREYEHKHGSGLDLFGGSMTKEKRRKLKHKTRHGKYVAKANGKYVKREKKT